MRQTGDGRMRLSLPRRRDPGLCRTPSGEVVSASCRESCGAESSAPKPAVTDTGLPERKHGLVDRPLRARYLYMPQSNSTAILSQTERGIDALSTSPEDGTGP